MMHGDRLKCFRVAVTIQLRAKVKLKPFHWATVHGLMREAYGVGLPIADHVIPDGLLLDAPERGRIFLRVGDRYRFGFTLLANDAQHATRIARDVTAGLEHAGHTQPLRQVALGGNFELTEVRDLVAGQLLVPTAQLIPIDDDCFWQQICHAQALGVLTLRFDSPYRATRRGIARTPGHDKIVPTPGHKFIDAGCFDAGLFLERLQERLRTLCLLEMAVEDPHTAVLTLENRLHWIDEPYSWMKPTTLGGAVGRVTIACHSPHAARQLVLGQYVRVGRNTAFGFGAYRIEELGPDPHACCRSQSLLDLALRRPHPDARHEEIPSGEIEVALHRLAAGQYEAAAPIRIQSATPSGGVRTVSISQPRDRILQRIVLDGFAPALEQLFEESSFARSKNLRRHSSARCVQRAIAEGWTFALRADFDKFFDSIDHRLLRDRLEATLADERLIALLMHWVTSASPTHGCGLPTGAPISPVLANLFLDEFDKQIIRSGGLLVRYADDFLILYRDRASADHALYEAENAARALALTLNDHKTQYLELRDPFDFLGFRFQRNGQWSTLPPASLRQAADLGWEMIEHRRADGADAAMLPGETAASEDAEMTWVVFGPEARHVRLDNGQLQCVYRGEALSRAVPVGQVRELIVLGEANFQPSALSTLLKQGSKILLSDDSARRFATVSPDDHAPDAAIVARQFACHDDPVWRLAIARRLVAAKVWNYSCLADAFGAHRHDRTCADGLRHLAERCEQADAIDSLLGFEGVAAARWYALFGQVVPSWCGFRRRVAPQAEDPANILLNLAHTLLHRQLILAVQGANMLSSVGILHDPRPGHAALASDLQELFRHLMDRAVLQVLPQLRPSDFRADPTGPHAVAIAPAALRKVIESIHIVFLRACTSGQPAARSYLGWFHYTARSLRLHLLDRSKPFVVFRHMPLPASAPEPSL